MICYMLTRILLFLEDTCLYKTVFEARTRRGQSYPVVIGRWSKLPSFQVHKLQTPSQLDG